MSINYAMIARNNKVVLTEYTEYKGGFPQVAREILPKLTPESKQSIGIEDRYYHIITSNNIHYMCYTKGEYNKMLVFAFLSKLKDAILSKYNYEQIMCAEEQGIPEQDTIKEILDEFNSKDDQDFLSTSQMLFKKTVELKEEMIQNLSEFIERDGLLDELLEKSKALEGVSIEYVIDSKDLKRRMRRRYIIYGAILFVVVLLVAYIIVGLICGFTFSCFRKSKWVVM